MRALTHRATGAGLRRADAVPGLVSVVLPALNASAWISHALASVRRQSYRNSETIVVDDGSTDDTGVIAERCGARLVRTAGAGPGGARNAGMAVARGEFLQFLDADDLLASGKIARQVAVLRSSGAEVAWEPFHELVPSQPGASEFVIGAKVVPELGPDLAASFLTTRGFIQLGALLIRRTARTDGIWFEEGRGTVEDVRYAIRLAMCGARFVPSDTGEPGLLYRQHTGPRYSRRPALAFAAACAANATWAHAEWEREGTLGRARRAALGEAYAFAARQLAALRSSEFAAVAARARSLGSDFTQHLPLRVRCLSRVVGYERAEAIATGWRRARSTLARSRRASGSQP